MERYTLSILSTIFCLLSFGGFSQDTTAIERPKVGLVLSGGSAHGLAHIGVIKALEELEIPIDYISGTSMGSIIGAYKALGYSADEIKESALSLNWDRILSNHQALEKTLPIHKFYHDKYPLQVKLTKKGLTLPIGIINSHLLDMTLKRLFFPAFEERNFHSFSIPFQCYTVDIVSGKVITQTEGSLNKALRASMAIPAYFPPVRTEERIYIDGGIERNFPVDETKAMGANVIIGSYVGARRKTYEEINSIVDIARQGSFLMSLKDYDVQKKKVHVLITPEVKGSSSLDFSKDAFNIEQGYRDAMLMKEELLKLKDSLDLGQPKKLKKYVTQAVTIDSIIVKGVNNASIKKFVLKKLGLKAGEHLLQEQIEAGVNSVYITSDFSKVDYEIEPRNGKNYLILDVAFKKDYSIGLNLNVFRTTGPAGITQLHLKNLLGNLTDFRSTVRLSEYPGINLSYFTRSGFIGARNVIIGFDASSERSKYDLYSVGDRKKSYVVRDMRIDPFISWDIYDAFQFSIYHNYWYSKWTNFINAADDISTFSEEAFRMGLRFQINSLNHEIMPSRGLAFEFNMSYAYKRKVRFNSEDNEILVNSLDTLYNGKNATQIRLAFRHAVSLSDRWVLGYRINGSLATDYSLQNIVRFGGTEQNKRDRLAFVGLKESERYLNDFIYGRIELNYNFYGKMHLGLVGNALAGINSYYLVLNENQIYNSACLGLLYRMDSPIGPLQAEFGYNPVLRRSKFSWSVGYRHIF